MILMMLALAAGGRASAQDAALVDIGRNLALDSRVAEQALITARGELWKQVRDADRAERDLQFARYQCLSAVPAAEVADAFGRVFAQRLDPAALKEMAGFYARRDLQQMMERLLRPMRQRNGLPDFSVVHPLDRDEISGRATMALGAMRETPNHKAFEQAAQNAYSGPVRTALAGLQDRCAPARGSPLEPLTPGKITRQSQPQYPVQARRHGVQGLMEVVVDVGADGKPVKVAIVKRWFNVPDKALPEERAAAAVATIEAAAVESLMGAVFEPALRGGQAVAAAYRLPYNFVLGR
jgi:hypothetical protein